MPIKFNNMEMEKRYLRWLRLFILMFFCAFFILLHVTNTKRSNKKAKFSVGTVNDSSVLSNNGLLNVFEAIL